MAVNDNRWHQLGPPATNDEAAALDTLRALLPDSPLTHAWANVTFRDREGRASEIDVILLHDNGMYFLELKGWHGAISGNQQHWTVTAPNGRRRVEPDPFLTTNRKAQRFAEEFKEAARRHGGRNVAVPFIRAVTVLHGHGSTVSLAAEALATTYALEGYDVKGVPSIRELLEAPPQQASDVIDGKQAKALVALVKSMGLQATPKVRMVGQYAVEKADPLGEGPGWVDVRAKHPVIKGGHRRIRLYDVPPKASPAERRDIEQMAHREMGLVERLEHPGIVRPLDILVTEAGPSLVFPDDQAQVPLLRYLQANAPEAEARLGLIRKIGEVMEYAHRHGVQHRSLSPAAVHVLSGDSGVRVLVRDWQAGRRDPREGMTRSTTLYSGVSEVAGAVGQDAWLYLAPESHQPSPGGVPLDVYGLGALAFLILTDQPPSTNLAELQERLGHGGLDPAADRDGLPPPVCALVRAATNPDLVERTPSVAAFLEALTAAAAQEVDERVEASDPREADVGTLIADRWEVKARLGSGASGIALLVDDYATGQEGVVLKVAVDDRAAERIRTEADVLADLDHRRVVRRLEGPFDVAGHVAVLIEDAGRPTLGRRLADEGRLTLEQLERYGQDLFEAVDHLDSRGVFHRDIKPDNLGVRESAGDRTRHLVLFDFSLSNEELDKTRSGTPGYMDPFLGSGSRRRYDSAAERFGVAATLFEMATGTKPEWGDGQSDPALISDEVHLAASMFEPEIADGMLGFFRQALARDAADRFDDMAEMAQAWSSVFPSAPTSHVQEASQQDRDAAAAAASLATPLEDAGLTARAVSAARRLEVHTVQELLDASAFEINRLPGVGVLVRSELQRRRRAWAARFAPTSVIENELVQLLRGVESTQAMLVPGERSRASRASALARRLLNMEVSDDAPDWPDHASAAADAGTTGDPEGDLALLVAHWRKSSAMTELQGEAREALRVLGGVATVHELAERLVAVRGSTAEGAARRRNATGLLRAVVEADAGTELAVLRHGTEVLVTSTAGSAPEDRLDAVAALAAAVDEMVTDRDRPIGPNAGLDLVRTHPRSAALAVTDPQRAVVVAAHASAATAVSSRGELYPRGMPAVAAVTAVLGFTPPRITPDRLRALAGSRFPAAEPVPARPQLDSLVTAANPSLIWDPDTRAYARATAGSSSLLSTGTVYTPGVPVRFDEVHESLRASLASRSAVVLATSPHRILDAPTALAARYGVTVVDVTAALIAAMHEQAAEAGVDWSLVLRADAAAPGTGDHTNLQRLVADATARFWPALLARPESLLLTDVAPLARYGQTARLADLLDTTTVRPAGRWLLVPKRAVAAAPTLDGVALPVAATTWIDLPDAMQESA